METKDIEIVEQKEGISLTDIFKRIWHAKITLLVTFVAIFVVAVVGIEFAISKPSETYTGEIIYQFMGADEGLYPSGARFDYRNLTSEENLVKIKNSKEEYQDIDIQNIIDNNQITLSLGTDSIVNENGETVTSPALNHVIISIPASNFQNQGQARDFINDLLNAPYTVANSYYDNLSFDENLVLADSSSTYEQEISYLISQRDLLIENYTNLGNTFGFYVPVAANSDTTLTNALLDLNQFVSNNKLENMLNEAELQGYLKLSDDETSNSNTIKSLQSELEGLLKTYDLNKAKIDELQAQLNKILAGAGNVEIAGTNEFITRIATLTETNIGIKHQADLLAKKLNATINYETSPIEIAYPESIEDILKRETPLYFVEDIKSATAKLKSSALELKSATTYLYTTYGTPIYPLINVITKTGGFSLVLNLAVSLVLALIIALVVAGIKGSIDIKKENSLKEETENLNK